MPLYEFSMLCADEESCKRVRFSQQTGIAILPVMNKIKGYVPPIYKDQCKQGHNISFEIQDIMLKNPEYSQEIICDQCKCIITLFPFEHLKLEQTCFVGVDFPNYDQNDVSFLNKYKKDIQKRFPKNPL